jgi:hypothetical protein
MVIWMVLLMVLSLPMIWIVWTVISNYAHPIKVMRLEERKVRKTIPTGCGVQVWAPEEKTKTTNYVELGG